VSTGVTRRSVLTTVLLCSSACRSTSSAPQVSSMDLRARPRKMTSSSLRPGASTVPLSNGRQGVLAVPDGEISGLVVALHGAGGQPAGALRLFDGVAARVGLAMLAPASAGTTWAMLRRGPDPDTPALDIALGRLFQEHPFDPARVAIAGFSDGASYALSLGLANGTLFPKVVAFSPGFEAADRHQGRPAFFITHGTRDEVLPINRTSRRIVPALRRNGYDVTYQEFDGGHAVPPQFAVEAADWILR
jgi:phospholipase/carboxylesterase